MKTAWEKSGDWYDKIVGQKGHYYHQALILPRLFKILDLQQGDTLLDLGCGQGVVAHHLPKGVGYTGIDGSKHLIAIAKQRYKKKQFLCADATKKIEIEKKFSHACIILALQNMEKPDRAIRNISLHLNKKGKFVFVLNHPCFRIPRQSSWDCDSHSQIQSRKIQRYMTPMEIPIATHPSKGGVSEKTFSYHHPISDYTKWLANEGFSIIEIEEWCSDKKSTGKYAKRENRARIEFPLFMTFICKKES